MRLFDAHIRGCYHQPAGWSSLVARWAHNPKVGGSNPPPATNLFNQLQALPVTSPAPFALTQPTTAQRPARAPLVSARSQPGVQVKRGADVRVPEKFALYLHICTIRTKQCAVAMPEDAIAEKVERAAYVD